MHFILCSYDVSVNKINGDRLFPAFIVTLKTKAFLPYYSTKEQGSGIGLSICKEVIDAHSGSIELNNNPAGGLEIKLIIPIT